MFNSVNFNYVKWWTDLHRVFLSRVLSWCGSRSPRLKQELAVKGLVSVLWKEDCLWKLRLVDKMSRGSVQQLELLQRWAQSTIPQWPAECGCESLCPLTLSMFSYTVDTYMCYLLHPPKLTIASEFLMAVPVPWSNIFTSVWDKNYQQEMTAWLLLS